MRAIDAIGLKQALAISAILGDTKTIEQIIDEQPTVEPWRKTGKWIDTGSGQECDQCREIQYGYDTGRNYCANCGAKMEGVNR